MNEFMQKLNETNFIENMKYCFDIIPMPKDAKAETLVRIRREAVWSCLKSRLQNDEELNESFTKFAVGLAKEAILNELELDYAQGAPNKKDALKNILSWLFDEKMEEN